MSDYEDLKRQADLLRYHFDITSEAADRPETLPRRQRIPIAAIEWVISKRDENTWIYRWPRGLRWLAKRLYPYWRAFVQRREQKED